MQIVYRMLCKRNVLLYCRLHDVNNAGIVFEHSVYKSKDSAVELFEDRAYRCGISLEKDGVDSEESVNSISQSSHCQSGKCCSNF